MALAFLVLVVLAALTAIGFFLYGVFLGILVLSRLSARGYARLKGREPAQTAPLQRPDPFASFRKKGSKADRPLYCWEDKACWPAQKGACPAYGVTEIPCWLARIRASANKVIWPDCLGCKRFSIPQALEHV